MMQEILEAHAEHTIAHDIVLSAISTFALRAPPFNPQNHLRLACIDLIHV